MSRLFVTVLVIVAGVTLAAGALLGRAQRTIPYDSNLSIPVRLLPNDNELLVVRKLFPEPRVTRTETIDDELRRLSRAELVAIVRIETVRGEFTDNGSWIRTRIGAQVERLVHTKSQTAKLGQIEFGFSGGRTEFRGVGITAGTFPRFMHGERYLVFLEHDPGIRTFYPAVAFKINREGVTERVKNNLGVEQSFETNFVGRNVSEVIAGLSRIK